MPRLFFPHAGRQGPARVVIDDGDGATTGGAEHMHMGLADQAQQLSLAGRSGRIFGCGAAGSAGAAAAGDADAQTAPASSLQVGLDF